MKVYSYDKLQSPKPSKDSFAITGRSRKSSSPQPDFVTLLNNNLDHHFNMLCDVRLEKLDKPIPFLLIGPAGIWVIDHYGERGIFQASGADWAVFIEQKNEYKALKPNPITHVLRRAAAVSDELTQRGFQIPQIEPVLYFSNPGAHIKTDRPAAKIVLVDSLERFIHSIKVSPVRLNIDTVQNIISVLLKKTTHELLYPAGEIQDQYSLRDLQKEKMPSKPSRLAQISRKEPGILRQLSLRLPFTSRQWVLIAILLVVNMIILVLLVLVIVTIT